MHYGALLGLMLYAPRAWARRLNLSQQTRGQRQEPDLNASAGLAAEKQDTMLGEFKSQAPGTRLRGFGRSVTLPKSSYVKLFEMAHLGKVAGITEDVFYTVINIFMDGVIYGKPHDPESRPRFLQSIFALRNGMLRKYKGNQVKCARKVTSTYRGFTNEVKKFFSGTARHVMVMLFPPFAVLAYTMKFFRSLWITLRKVCLIIAVRGYDLNDQDNRNKAIILAFGVPIPVMGGETTRIVVKQVFQALLAPYLPIIGGIATLPIEYVMKKVNQIFGNLLLHTAAKIAFPRTHEITEEEYKEELDPEPVWRSIDRALGDLVAGSPVEKR